MKPEGTVAAGLTAMLLLVMVLPALSLCVLVGYGLSKMQKVEVEDYDQEVGPS